MELVYLAISIVLVVMCGFFVAAEFSLIAVSRVAVDRLVEQGDAGAVGLKKALVTLSTQLSGAQVGITVTNLAIGFLAEPAIARLLAPPLVMIGVPEPAVAALSIALGIFIATAFTMIFGELVPKNLAITLSMATAKFVQRYMQLFSRLTKYPIKLLNSNANFILRRFGVKPLEELASARSADELLSLVRHSAAKGTLTKEMALMLERSLNFGDLTAAEVMTPRVRVHFASVNDSVASVLEMSKLTGVSRFPVFGKNLDDIVGIVHIKHAVGVPRADRADVTVAQVMRPPALVPSNIQLEPLLGALRKGGLQLAVVVDEFGGTDGIVTIEDLFEELIGDVRDEHDSSKVTIRKLADGGWTISGLLRPDEISGSIGIFLPDEEDDDSDTLAGLITYYLERMPETGDSVLVNAIGRDGTKIVVKLRVERMDGRRIDIVKMSIIERDSQEINI